MQSKPSLTSDFPRVHVNPICCYAPEPLPRQLRHELKEIGRAAADEIIGEIESRHGGKRSAGRVDAGTTLSERSDWFGASPTSLRASRSDSYQSR